MRPDPADQPYVLGPADSIILPHELELSESDVIEIRNEKRAIWAIVEVEYTDTFGNRWFTKVRSYMTGAMIDDPDDRRMNISDYQAT